MSPKIIEDFYGFNNYYLVLDLDDYFEIKDKHPLYDCFNSCNQFLLLMEGECSYRINNKKHTCSKGSLITFQKDQIQKLDCTNNAKGYILLFSNELLKERNYDLFLEINISFLKFAMSSAPLTLNEKDYSEIIDIIQILNHEVSQINDLLKNDISSSLIKRILEILEQLKGSNNIELNTRDISIFKEFNLLLSTNLNKSRSVKFYANLLAISTKKLNFVTKTYWSKTAKEFIEERIVFDSKKLLLDTPNTVKQISYSMGFTEPTNFNKFFKKFTDTTPLRFRETHNKGSF